jgi:hypothetical protein
MVTETRESERWRLKKEVSVGDIIAFLMAFAALVAAYSTLDRRITVLETHGVVQRDRDAKQDEEHFRSLGRIESELARISSRLEKLVEQRK